MSVGFLAVGWVATVLSWVLISKYGRRRIYNIGLAIMTIVMFLIAFLDFAPDYENRPGIIWAQSTLLVGYDLSISAIIVRMYFAQLTSKRSSGTAFLISQSVPSATS
jgi:SP family general alpha glucoside:H+ symporter-like MFS transporter